ncbi:MAG: hypothetical protein ACFFB3_11760 [Candidatus Hodarchaeota archaeon]
MAEKSLDQLFTELDKTMAKIQEYTNKAADLRRQINAHADYAELSKYGDRIRDPEDPVDRQFRKLWHEFERDDPPDGRAGEYVQFKHPGNTPKTAPPEEFRRCLAFLHGMNLDGRKLKDEGLAELINDPKAFVEKVTRRWPRSREVWDSPLSYDRTT